MSGTIESSNVEDVDYDKRAKELIITFVGGRKYLYRNISGQRFSAFMRSDSAEKYVNEHFKDMKSIKVK